MCSAYKKKGYAPKHQQQWFSLIGRLEVISFLFGASTMNTFVFFMCFFHSKKKFEILLIKNLKNLNDVGKCFWQHKKATYQIIHGNYYYSCVQPHAFEQWLFLCMMGLLVGFILIRIHFCDFYNKYMPDEVTTWRRAKIDFKKIRFKQVEVGRKVTEKAQFRRWKQQEPRLISQGYQARGGTG